MNARKYDVLTLTNTNGAISHTDANGKTVAEIYIGHLTDVSIHFHGVNGHSIIVHGTNESEPADESLAVALGDPVAANALVIVEDGPLSLFIEVDAAGTGTPTAIVTGRVWAH